jgi:hypothetical protein
MDLRRTSTSPPSTPLATLDCSCLALLPIALGCSVHLFIVCSFSLPAVTSHPPHPFRFSSALTLLVIYRTSSCSPPSPSLPPSLVVLLRLFSSILHMRVTQPRDRAFIASDFSLSLSVFRRLSAPRACPVSPAISSCGGAFFLSSSSHFLQYHLPRRRLCISPRRSRTQNCTI